MKTRISGAVCGTMWMPMVTGGYTVSFDLNDKRRRFTDHATISETLESWLREHGGDFQDARFTADTEIIFEFYKPLKSGRPGYEYHVRSYELGNCPSLADLVDTEHYCGDFMD